MREQVSLRERLEAAREHVRPGWDATRAAHLAERAQARQRRRTLARAAAVGAGSLGLLAMAWAMWPPTSRDPGSSDLHASAETDPTGTLRFADGSIATPLGRDSELFVDVVRDDAIELVLVRGAARFEVTPGLPRAFRVRAGRITVSVVGTVFTVRREGAGAAVEVDEGRVHVAWEPDGEASVGAGERGVFPTEPSAAQTIEAPPSSDAPPSSEPAPPLETEVADAPSRSERARRVRDTPAETAERAAVDSAAVDSAAVDAAPMRAWRALAEAGRFDEGYGLLLADPTVLPSRDVEALMQAADCARLSGHPSESLAYLRRALAVGPADPRAPMVAFTLGRVLLQQLGRPTDAAEAFALARQLAPAGSLASDALAREVEAWHRAGDAERARERATEYLGLYPRGLRATAVRRYGGLE